MQISQQVQLQQHVEERYDNQSNAVNENIYNCPRRALRVDTRILPDSHVTAGELGLYTDEAINDRRGIKSMGKYAA
jgi:hypothetical protein